MFVRRLAIAAAALCAPAALAEPLTVNIDQTMKLSLATPADSVVIGNATVIDVAIHDPMTLLLTGKAFGTTNLMVLDKAGRTVYSNKVSIADDRNDQLTIVRNGASYTYSCTDKCRATPMVGDAPEHFGQVMSSVNAMKGPAQGN